MPVLRGTQTSPQTQRHGGGQLKPTRASAGGQACSQRLGGGRIENLGLKMQALRLEDMEELTRCRREGGIGKERTGCCLDYSIEAREAAAV